MLELQSTREIRFLNTLKPMPVFIQSIWEEKGLRSTSAVRTMQHKYFVNLDPDFSELMSELELQLCPAPQRGKTPV